MVLAAQQWFYWLGVVLFAASAGGVAMSAIGYYLKVSRNKVNRVTKK